jgi:hypothetical protein
VEPSGTHHYNQINEDMHQTGLRLGVREILGLPPLFDLSQEPRRHQPKVEEKMVLPVTEVACQDLARSRHSHMPRTNPSQDPMQPLAMAAARQRRRGDPRIHASAPPPRYLLPTCRQSHAPAAARSPLHLIALACLLCPLPFGETGAATAACAGDGSGRRVWRLGLVGRLLCCPSGGRHGSQIRS